MEAINNIIKFQIFYIGEYSFTIGILLNVIIIIAVTKLLIFGVKKALFSKKHIIHFDAGTMYSLFQLFQYIIWIFAILIILDAIGIEANVLLASSAALLVGVGLGLQNTFNDFVSGIILLFEGSIKVGDVLEIDGEVVKIQKMGLRTSEAIDRDDIAIIIPNSLITTNKVINWSHQSKRTRFSIKVRVAYGSDVDLVLKILADSAMEHPEVSDKSLINPRFLDFGPSSLDFELLFFSQNVFRIENMKSEIRKIINRKFIENNITIPFPQMDLHFKSNNVNFVVKEDIYRQNLK